MRCSPYIRFATYAVLAACIAILWSPSARYVSVDLSIGFDRRIPPIQQAGSWRDFWMVDAGVYRAAKLGPARVMDLAEEELLRADWKQYRPINPKIRGVTLSPSATGLWWHVSWVDAEGYSYHVSVDDATSTTRHDPSVNPPAEKEWPFPEQKKGSRTRRYRQPRWRAVKSERTIEFGCLQRGV